MSCQLLKLLRPRSEILSLKSNSTHSTMSRYTTPGQNKTLSQLQKRLLITLAREAYAIATHAGLTELTFDEWRHNECHGACGTTISKAVNGDFNKLKSHFLNLKGDSRGALEALDKDATEATRQAMHALDRELGDRGLPRAYAEAICRDTFHCDLSKATPEQLLKVRFTVRSRRKSAATT